MLKKKQVKPKPFKTIMAPAQTWMFEYFKKICVAADKQMPNAANLGWTTLEPDMNFMLDVVYFYKPELKKISEELRWGATPLYPMKYRHECRKILLPRN